MTTLKTQPQENVKIEMPRTEAEILALIDADDLEMPSWDQGCYCLGPEL